MRSRQRSRTLARDLRNVKYVRIVRDMLTEDDLAKKLIEAREKRGWTIYAAAQNARSVKRETLTRLEQGKSRPENIPVINVIDIIDIYWPDIQLRDFIWDDSLKRYNAKRGRR